MLLRPCRAGASHFKLHQTHHHLKRHGSSWAEKISNPHSQIQSYISKSTDPFVNLSIEHFLFQKSPPGSKILFLYTNRPCIVIGRNQNPWLEVNLGLLQPQVSDGATRSEPPGLGNIDLVRRRSGGGTVFHDEGNVNWSVICDTGDFTRDKHAEMVVRCLRRLGIERARVNERHDIVLDQGIQRRYMDESDTHSTPYTVADAIPRPLKVSGSAYKLSRTRALHHGTALLQSPNLHIIPHYLHSPAKSYITAKGVESVSSPVSNIGVDNASFEDAVHAGFTSTYGSGTERREELDDSLLEIPEIDKGHAELKVSFGHQIWGPNMKLTPMQSLDWIFTQTPQFVFSTQPIDPNILDRPVRCSLHPAPNCFPPPANWTGGRDFLHECPLRYHPKLRVDFLWQINPQPATLPSP
jgi:lipoate-protein ligase A